MKSEIQELLKRLGACPVNFDPQADHAHGTAQPSKVAFVPVELFEELKEVLGVVVQN